MPSDDLETSNLLPSGQPTTSPQREPGGRRTVKFNPLTTISTYGATGTADPAYGTLQTSPSGQRHPPQRPSGLAGKLRRRNSYPYNAGPLPAAPKIGPQRTTKNAQKLKLLPDPVGPEDDEAVDDYLPRDVYSQITRIKEPTARSHAARLGKADREHLPRVTAYCTANAYQLDGVIRFLKSRAPIRGSNPKLYDECVYSPFNYQDGVGGGGGGDKKKQKGSGGKDNGRNNVDDAKAAEPRRRLSDSAVGENNNRLVGDLIDFGGEEQDRDYDRNEDEEEMAGGNTMVESAGDFDTTIHIPEIFLFDYGTVVIWGMSPSDESRFLSEVARFATSILGPGDAQVENFNFYYTREYQARIYNDFISLREPRNHMIKLAISHALAQSVKTSLFEDLLSATIAQTAPLPAQIAQTGSVNLTRRQINMQIGQLFVLRINIHLQGSVLDSPELMWAEPQLDPVYQAVRSYLEMDQRVGVLTERLDVVADLLAVLKDQLAHRHGEYLEWIGK